MNSRKYTDAQVREFHRRAVEGEAVWQIAYELNVGISTVYSWFRELGLPKPKRIDMTKNELLDLAIEYVRGKRSLRQIARKAGFWEPESLRNRWKVAGISITNLRQELGNTMSIETTTAQMTFLLNKGISYEQISAEIAGVMQLARGPSTFTLSRWKNGHCKPTLPYATGLNRVYAKYGGNGVAPNQIPLFDRK